MLYQLSSIGPPRAKRAEKIETRNSKLDAVLRIDRVSNFDFPISKWSGRRESNPRPTAWKAVTLPLSYSRNFESRKSKFETRLSGLPTSFEFPVSSLQAWWTGEGSNLRRPHGSADLQSAAFDHSATCPVLTSSGDCARTGKCLFSRSTPSVVDRGDWRLRQIAGTLRCPRDNQSRIKT